MKKYLLLLVLHFFESHLFSQQIDSLLSINTNDTSMISSYGDIMDKNKGNTDVSNQLLLLYNKSIDIASKNNFNYGKANINNRYAIYLKTINEYDQSIEYQAKAIVLCRKYNYDVLLAKCLNNNANIFNNRGDYAGALKAYIEALQIFEKNKMDKQYSSTLMSIGNVYADQGNGNLAIEYYKKAIEIKKKLKDEVGVMNLLVNIGGVYYDQRNYTQATNYFKQSLVKSKSMKEDFTQSVCLSNLAEIYGVQANYTEALKYALEAEKIKTQLNDENSLAITYITLGDIYAALKDKVKAKEYYMKSLAIGKKLNSHEITNSSYDALAEFSKENMDFELALMLRDSATFSKDSMYNEAKMKQITELEAKYQNEKNKLEIANSNLKLKSKNNLLIALAIGFLAFIIISFLIYNRYKLKQKQKIDEILLIQQEQRHKAVFDAEEKERVRIARDLHDGVGQLLSAVKMNLTVAQTDLDHPKNNQNFNTALTILDESVKEVRSVSHNMVPNALIKKGLAGAVREFVQQMQGNMKVELEVVGLKNRIEETKETVLFRVLQELVNNIIKHAKANKIVIQLVEHDKEISLMIEDNGVGFDSTKVQEYAGIGLKNIITRIEYVNGTVDFDSKIGRGTIVNIEVPK